MSDDKMKWIDEQEKKVKEERSNDYLHIEEGENRFVLLSHCAPLPQVYVPSEKKFRMAVEGDTGVSIKGICWVWQTQTIKQARLPYKVVKQIRALSTNEDWEFTLPFPHVLTLTAKGAGTKEVEYSLTPSPKKIEIPPSVMDELSKKPTPEEIVEKIRGNNSEQTDVKTTIEYPHEELNPDDIPF